MTKTSPLNVKLIVLAAALLAPAVALALPITPVGSPITSTSPAVATTKADVGRTNATRDYDGYSKATISTTAGGSTLMPDTLPRAALIGTGDATMRTALFDSAVPTSAVMFTA